MTWQRMDENTYIDDSLVTCAEYQLFIDEMCEQEEYYQPDHWKSRQFQPGKARDPVLGTRPSDAEVFCKWLNNHDEDNLWEFRLPRSGEAECIQIKSNTNFPVGFWTLGENHTNPFMWANRQSGEVKTFSIDQLNGNVAFKVGRPLELVQHHLQLTAIARQFTRDFDAGIYFLPSRGQAILHSFEILSELWSILRSSKTFAQNEDYILRNVVEANYYINFILDRGQALDFDKYDDNEGDNLQQAEKLLRDHLTARTVFDNERPTIDDPIQEQFSIQTLEVLRDVVTLHARVEMRSPAFEGILLVKERK